MVTGPDFTRNARSSTASRPQPVVGSGVGPRRGQHVTSRHVVDAVRHRTESELECNTGSRLWRVTQLLAMEFTRAR
jgi:hypothetical protein